MGIIVEGPDGAGKTTLIGLIQSQYPRLQLQERVVSKETKALVDMEQWLENDVRLPKGPRLYDRHRIISHPIYNLALNRDFEGNWMDFDWLNLQQSLFFMQRHFVIFCLPPRPLVVHNCERDPNNAAVAAWAGIIWDAYAATIMRWSGPHSIYDYTGSTESSSPLEQILRRVGATVRGM